MDRVNLSVVIGTYNRLELLERCLDSLIGKIRAEHEIVVVDAGSTDGTLEYLGHLPGIRLERDGELVGQATSLNRIFRTLQSDYVCWLSDDDIAVAGMLDVAVGILKRNPDIGMVGLKVQDLGPDAHPYYLGGIWESGIITVNQGMLPTRVLQSLGGFDEEFRDYGIDGDLTTRVLLGGYKVVLTKRIVLLHHRHRQGTSWIDGEGRDQRMQHAIDLYASKYADLIQSEYGGKYDKHQQFVQFRKIKRIYHQAQQHGISLEKWIGYSARDWKNLIAGRFVSRWDFLRYWFMRYHFVQQIPKGLIKQLQISKASPLGSAK